MKEWKRNSTYSFIGNCEIELRDQRSGVESRAWGPLTRPGVDLSKTIPVHYRLVQAYIRMAENQMNLGRGNPGHYLASAGFELEVIERSLHLFPELKNIAEELPTHKSQIRDLEDRVFKKRVREIEGDNEDRIPMPYDLMV